MMTWWQAAILGIVEGLTEFLPVSSTGHLIIVSHWLGLRGQGINTFEVVIQSGAIVAVLGLYRKHVRLMVRGLLNKEEEGKQLLIRLAVSFFPSGVLGVAAHSFVKENLFGSWPVVFALAAGGVLMIAVDRWMKYKPSDPRHRAEPRTLASITLKEALLIGLAQCLALWPGMSRSMTTIVAGLLLGLPAPLAAEYSFLLALPTLGAATFFDLTQNGAVLFREVPLISIVIGFAAAGAVAFVAMQQLIRYLNQSGLALFGKYRIGLALLVWMTA
jgi:undecaprenyl-diphosphatase